MAAIQGGSDNSIGLHFSTPGVYAVTPMNSKVMLVAILGAFVLLWPRPSLPQSLGKISRELRRHKAQEEHKPLKAYTNDNIPHAEPAESTARPPARSEAPPSSVTAQTGHSETTGAKPETVRPQSTALSREYWQAKFKTARATLARATEEQQLVDDELNLLQIRKSRELDPSRLPEFVQEIEAKQALARAKRAATEKAQKAVDEILEEFKKNGARQGAITTEDSP
jgi:hypothetical protein